MNIEDIKKRMSMDATSFKDLYEDRDWLVKRLEQAEKALEKISKNAYLDHLGDVSLLMLQMSGNIADEALKAIRRN